MGNCPECCNKIGACNSCGEDFADGTNILCFEEEKHFCNDDCLVMWLKDNNKLKETYFERGQEEELLEE